MAAGSTAASDVLAALEVLQALRRAIQRTSAGHDSSRRLGGRRRRAVRPQPARLVRLRRHALHRSRPRPERQGRHPSRRRGRAAAAFEIDRFPEAQRERRNAAAYLELHIEQGPVLESAGPAAWRRARNQRRRTSRDHVPRPGSALRLDADERRAGTPSPPLRNWRWRFARSRGKHPDAVCTIGSVKTFPGIVTAVVGRCETTLDQRDLDAERAGANASRGARGQRTVRQRRGLHRRVVAHLEHRAGAVPSGADSTCAKRPYARRPERRTGCRPVRCTTPPKSPARAFRRDDVRAVAARDQPQQNRRYARKSTWNWPSIALRQTGRASTAEWMTKVIMSVAKLQSESEP